MSTSTWTLVLAAVLWVLSMLPLCVVRLADRILARFPMTDA